MSAPNIEHLAPPPRRLRLPVRCHQRFGGALNQGAWFWMAFCTPFFWLFFMDCEGLSWLKFARPLSTCGGTVTRVDAAGGEENETPIMAIHYSYALDGKECSGCSYQTGTTLSPGNAVTIEYATSSPLVSRIQGLRHHRFGGPAVLVLLFPAIGIGLLAYGWKKGQRARRLLESGVLGTAALTSKVVASTGDDGTVYQLIFDFIAENGRTYTHSSTRGQRDLSSEDGPAAQILYDPADPSCAMLVDDLPAPVRIDEFGNLEPISSRRALAAMLLPIFTLAMNGIWAWKWLS